jgi:tetratricopeptide (TPR) repeat protein
MWPNHLGTIMNYARFKDRQGQPNDALQWYAKAVKQYPNEASLANDVGLFYARHGMNNEALAAYRRAIELQPKRALYRNNLAVLLVDLGQNQQALDELVSVYPEADACYKLGYLLQKKGLTRQATEYFARAVAINPAFREARMWLDHLQRQPGGGAHVAPRIPDNNPAPRSPWQGSPDPRGNDPSAVRPLRPVETPEGRQPEVRQLPPANRPLPGSGNDAPAQSPGAPSSGTRPLPPVSLGRPANRGEIQQTAAQARPAKEEGDRTLEDAPLPPAVPRSLAR